MSYKVLARKYRPQKLDDVIGQEHISETLRNAISENRIAHAYLFAGPRGVGKTTMARILAKALNCKDLQDSEPCGKCTNCLEITNGTSVDVQEIDAASNRGIDDIRTLRENVKFAPAASKYKVYIIDEAHQITTDAFNALLKTLEEPPSHVVFIMATTEAHKMPITILSRCQRYRFRLLSSKEIMGHLENIVKSEGFSVDPEALQIINSASGGSVRDALSLLDQAVSSVSGAVSAKDIQNLLGFLPKEIISEITLSLAKGNSEVILKTIKNVTEQGFNLIQFGRDLRDHLRNILLYKVNPDIIESTADEKKILDSQKDLFNESWLIRSGHLISRALDEMRWHDNPRIILELYLLRMAQPYLNADELFKKLENLGTKEYSGGPSSDKSGGKTADSYKTGQAIPETRELKENTPERNEVKTKHKAADPALESVWKNFLTETQSSRPLIWGYLNNSFVKEFNADTITIGAQNKFEESGIKNSIPFIENYLKEKLGKAIIVKVMLETGGKKPAEKAVELQEEIISEEVSPAEKIEFFEVKETESKQDIPHGLEKIINKFPGKVTKKPKNSN